MKTRFFTAAIALCLLGFTGCNKEQMNDAGTQAGTPVMMTLQTGSPETRADYTEDGNTMKFSWRANDEMSVVVNGVSDNENCKLTTATAGKSAPFSGTVTGFTDTKNIYAIYPYSDTPYSIANGGTPATATVALTLPNPQSYTVGGAIANSYLVGAGTATANNTAITASAGMKQVMSLIKLNITNAAGKKVTGVKLSCAEALFPTMATVKLSDASITNPDANVKELTMNVTDGTAATTSIKEVSFAMFPADLTNKKIQVSVWFADGTRWIVEKDGTRFERNMHYEMAVDASKAVEIKVGSFYLNDGTIVDKDATLTADQKAKCIGIVFYLNPNGTGGKIVSLNEGEGRWGDSSKDENTKGVAGIRDVNDGATASKNLITARKSSSSFATNYAAFNWIYATKNGNDVNGGWYLPAKNELLALYAAWNGGTGVANTSARTAFNAKLTAASGTVISATSYYWSSTEDNSSFAWDVGFSNSSVNKLSKSHNDKVRAVLAF